MSSSMRYSLVLDRANWSLLCPSSTIILPPGTSSDTCPVVERVWLEEERGVHTMDVKFSLHSSLVISFLTPALLYEIIVPPYTYIQSLYTTEVCPYLGAGWGPERGPGVMVSHTFDGKQRLTD